MRWEGYERYRLTELVRDPEHDENSEKSLAAGVKVDSTEQSLDRGRHCFGRHRCGSVVQDDATIESMLKAHSAEVGVGQDCLLDSCPITCYPVSLNQYSKSYLRRRTFRSTSDVPHFTQNSLHDGVTENRQSVVSGNLSQSTFPRQRVTTGLEPCQAEELVTEVVANGALAECDFGSKSVYVVDG